MSSTSSAGSSTSSCLRLSLADANVLARCLSKCKEIEVSAGKKSGLLLRNVETGKKMLGIPISPDIAIYQVSVSQPDRWTLDLEIKGTTGFIAELPGIRVMVSDGINQGQEFCVLDKSLRSATINWQHADAYFKTNFASTLFRVLSVSKISLNGTIQHAIVAEFSIVPPKVDGNV